MAKGLGHVAALSPSSLTNDQQHKDDNEDYKEGVAISNYQLHQAGLENLLPSVKKTKRLKKQISTSDPGPQEHKASLALLCNGYPEQTQVQVPAVLQFTSVQECGEKMLVRAENAEMPKTQTDRHTHTPQNLHS